MRKDTRNCMHYFEEMCKDTQKQAELLYQTAKENTQSAINENKKSSDTLLEESDKKKLILIKQLSKAFVTPIDREDILTSSLLVHKLSFMINDIFTQTVSQGLSNFGTVFVQPVQHITKSFEVLRGLSSRLSLAYSDYVIDKYLSEMSSLRQKGQELHFECVKKMFLNIRSPYELVVRQSVYEKIKECCDFSYDICDYLICVIIKNT